MTEIISRSNSNSLLRFKIPITRPQSSVIKNNVIKFEVFKKNSEIFDEMESKSSANKKS
jgi:hypothetical protein